MNSNQDNNNKDDDGICMGSLEEWLTTGLPLLDIRNHDQYAESHIKNSIHIPLSSVRQRSYELPPRQDAFAVLICSNNHQEEQEESLQLIREFFLCQEETTINNSTKKKKRAQKPWMVPLILTDGKITRDQAKECSILVEGHGTQHDAPNNTDIESFQPLPRLWQPDSMVKEVLLPILAKRLEETAAAGIKERGNDDHLYEIWDLGAGAGRDVAFLAEELKATATNKRVATFRVVAMDQRYRSLQSRAGNDIQARDPQVDPVEECIQFWKRRGIEYETRCVSVHWGNQTQDHAQWFRKQQQQSGTTTTHLLCLFMVRFWNQSLMEFLATSDTELVKEGTLVAVSQFAKPHPGASWNFDHPKEKNVLERHELRQMFSTDRGWCVLHDNIVTDSDHGRTLINFVAVRN
ncbi:expressed unknown protein [Seminavis robusta]|uniref:Rhodanese domain-containing protein n=1 Tax=Seminavis robusta TaxID=568900 RepID=A0A9N8HDK4_9STRA|nr:expressed unknown protein [Seminavis robusta]|eukprot:Sro365_g127340.1 n/a (406) ;mRNA; f:24701-26094